jgi:transcriptional regulator with XRE-family HTH domain
MYRTYIRKEKNMKEERSQKQKRLSHNSQILKALLTARNSRKMTQQELAVRSGINQANISKIENGVYNPSLAIISRLADAMDMDLHLQLVPRNGQSF